MSRTEAIEPILFLDVDGVLNNLLTQDKCPGGFIGICDRMVERLAKVVEASGASIVLSSTWRNHPDLKPYLLSKLGRIANRVIGKTPCIALRARGDEIQAWLTAHPHVKRFAIVDDADILGFNGRVVKTQLSVGLQDEHCKQLALILAR